MAHKPFSIVLSVSIAIVLIAVLLLSGCSGPADHPPTVGSVGDGERYGIWGYVRDGSGAPVSGALVAVSDGETLYTATSGSDGYYEIRNVPVGARVVSFDRDGYRTTHEATTVTSPTERVQVDGVLVSTTSQCPQDPPVITIESVEVDEEACIAYVSGEINTVLSDTAVLVLNGSEQIIPLDAGYRFDAVLILNIGENVAVIRASNCQGNSLSEPILPQCTAGFVFRVTLTWDTLTDIDLHTWGPGSSGGVQHSSYRDEEIDAGELDFDNITGYGPENFTARTVIPGRYAVGVNFYSYEEFEGATDCNIRVTVPGSAATDFGPHILTTPDLNEGYPITVDTPSWWRPVDIIVAADGSVSIVSPDTSIPYPEYSTNGASGLSSILKPKAK